MASTLWPTNGTFTGRQIRQTVGAAWGALTSRPLGARSGVVAGTPTSVVSISGSTYSVLAHKGVLDVESSAVAGPYNYSFDSTQTGTVNAADSTFGRIDLLSITMSDTSEGDASISGPTITYTAGTPASTPAAPSTPAKSVVLAQIAVPKLGTGSATITLIAPFAVAAGGIVPCRSTAEYPSSPYVGQYVDDASLGLLRWNGSAWGSTGTRVDTLPTGYSITPASGFSFTSVVYSRRADIVIMFVVCNRTGATLTATSTGALTDTSVCTLNGALMRPSFDLYVPWRSANSAGTAHATSDGVVKITDMSPNSSLVAGDTCEFNLMFSVTA